MMNPIMTPAAPVRFGTIDIQVLDEEHPKVMWWAPNLLGGSKPRFDDPTNAQISITNNNGSDFYRDKPVLLDVTVQGVEAARMTEGDLRRVRSGEMSNEELLNRLRGILQHPALQPYLGLPVLKNFKDKWDSVTPEALPNKSVLDDAPGVARLKTAVQITL